MTRTRTSNQFTELSLPVLKILNSVHARIFGAHLQVPPWGFVCQMPASQKTKWKEATRESSRRGCSSSSLLLSNNANKGRLRDALPRSWETRSVFFFINKTEHFVSAVPKVVPQKNQIKTGQTLDFKTFNLNEEMGGQKGSKSNTQKIWNALYIRSPNIVGQSHSSYLIVLTYTYNHCYSKNISLFK